MVSTRRATRAGASNLGCVFTLVVLVAVAYFGVNAGRVYWHFYQFQEDMRQEVRSARQRTNDQMLVRLRASADSLRLPEAARKISIRRTQTMISIESDYYEMVAFPMVVREIHFNPRAEGPL